MVMPKGIGAIDTMLGFPHRDMKEVYRFITRQTKDAQSKDEFDFPVEYMFKDVPEKGLQDVDDPIAVTVREMDLWGIEKGLIGVGDPAGTGAQALQRFPDRFIPSSGADPNEGMEGIRRLVREHETFGTRAVGVSRQGPSPRWRSTTRRCTRSMPSASSSASRSSAVPAFRALACRRPANMSSSSTRSCTTFPTWSSSRATAANHGPTLAVKLMLKWPGLHYSTSAFAPKYYPKDIIDYANSRGSDKIIYAGYFPMGLSLERIMTEMVHVGFKDEVWPKFLRGNALRVLGSRVGVRGARSVSGATRPRSEMTTTTSDTASARARPSTTRRSTRTTTTTRRPTPTPVISTRRWRSPPCNGRRSTDGSGCSSAAS